LDVGFKAPDNWFGVPDDERDQRTKLDNDVCGIDDDIYIRGCIEIPIIGQDEKFVWGVWVSVSKPSFSRILELWSEPVIENEPPRFGWLSNRISNYPDTTNLKTELHIRSKGLRPLIKLEPTDHPLAVEQHDGINMLRVQEIVAEWHKPPRFLD
jgi:hypothetical protein